MITEEAIKDICDGVLQREEVTSMPKAVREHITLIVREVQLELLRKLNDL